MSHMRIEALRQALEAITRHGVAYLAGNEVAADAAALSASIAREALDEDLEGRDEEATQ